MPRAARAYILLALWFAPVPAGAATFLVTKTQDAADGACDADCSLREAVLAAEANPGPDAILLGPGTYALTIQGDDADASQGDLDLTEDVEIGGMGAEATVLDASGLADRVFDVQGGTARIANLTLSGGVAEDGGCLRNGAADATLVNVTLRDCRGEGYRGGGGALNESDGSLTMIHARVEDCAAPTGYGGGVYNRGLLTLSAVSFARNAAPAPTYGGGGLYNSGDATLYECAFLDNTASAGGAILEANSFSNHVVALVAEKSLFARNRATGAYGGAIRAARDSVYLSACAFEDNAAATSGGAIYGASAGPAYASMIIENSVFKDNVATAGDGGALYLAADEGEASIAHATFSGNRAGGAGALLAQRYPSLTLANNVLDTPSPGGAACATLSGPEPVSLGGNVARDATCGLDEPTDAAGVDPGLADEAEFGMNGGATPTWPPAAGSPAIGAGEPAECLETDQRGFPRSASCSAGSYEADAPRCPPDMAPTEDPLDEITNDWLPAEADPRDAGGVARCLRAFAGLP